MRSSIMFSLFIALAAAFSPVVRSLSKCDASPKVKMSDDDQPNVAGKAKESLDHGVGQTKNAAQDAYHNTREKAEEAGDAVSNKYEETKDQAKGTAERIKDSTQSAFQKGKQAAKSTADDIMHAADKLNPLSDTRGDTSD